MTLFRMKRKTTRNKPTEDTSDITLHTLNQYFEGPKIYNRIKDKYEVRPIIGNESQRVLATLSWYIQKLSIILEGESGSAKSEMMNAIIVLIFGDDGLDGNNNKLFFIDSGSDQVQFRKEDEVKVTTHAFIPELQNANNYFDMLKKWSEGKIFQREVTKGDNAKKYKLPPRPVITCLAINNDVIKQLPSEMVRRYVHIYTKTTMDTTRKVKKRKGEIRALPDHELPSMDPLTQEKLKQKLIRASMEKRRVINPYAPIIQEFIPPNFTRSMSYVDYFFETIESITRFYCDERYGTEKYLFSNFRDNYDAIQIAGEIFLNMSLGIEDCGSEILEQMTDAKGSSGFGELLRAEISDDILVPDMGYYTVADIMKLMKDELGIYRDKTTTKEVVRKLVDAGYLGIRQPKSGKEVFYFKTGNMDDTNGPVIDWSEWNKFAIDWMQEHYSDDYEKWLKTQEYKYEDYHTGAIKEITMEM
jgi:hypothetical protein